MQVAPPVIAQVSPVLMQMVTGGPRIAVVAPEPCRLSTLDKQIGSDKNSFSDFAEDPFAVTRSPPPADNLGQANQTTNNEAAFGVSRNPSPTQRSGTDAVEGPSACGIKPISRSPWSPQSDDLLHGFRTSIQAGDRSKFGVSDFANKYDHMQMYGSRGTRATGRRNAEHMDFAPKHDNEYNKYRYPMNTATSEFLDFESQRTWSAVVKKNLRPIEQHRNRDTRPSNTFITLAACCATPKLRVICSCCSKETILKDELRPRVIPVATSQLGFCRFCQSNGDPAEVYRSHTLRSDDGKVTCPVLREYNCPLCDNGGGDFAHTIKYCPLARKAKPRN